MVKVLQDPLFANLRNCQHGFFTRQGGVSEGYYASLNCATHSKDDPECIRENRRRVMDHFGYPLDALATVKNVHGNNVLIVDESWMPNANLEADGMVSCHANIILGSTSADCPTILFADDHAGVIGIAHAGWRGAKCGVIEATVERMIFLGAKPENIHASISPCIRQDSYEVSDDFHQEFLKENVLNRVFFKPSIKEKHFLFNLPAYVKQRLAQLNLQSVSDMGIDTYTNENDFFSCRRATHQKEPDFACQLSCIVYTSSKD
jgi:YfiH family protein